MAQRLSGLLGILIILLTAYAVSRDRSRIRWRSVIFGVALQAGFAVAILGIPALGMPGVLRVVFMALNGTMTSLVDFIGAGSKFLFGPLAEIREPWGFVFAFRVLPSIIFFSGVMSALYYLGILQKVVKAVAFVMQKTMGTSGAETLSAVGNIFMGQTEAPLMVKPFIPLMTRSEIYCLMVGGMSTLPAGVEIAYISMLRGRISDIAGHLLTASVMGACGGLVISKMIFPESEEPVTRSSLGGDIEETGDANALEALARGTSDGVMLALNVAAMLIVFISLIAIFDAVVGHIGTLIGIQDPLTLALIFGKTLQPLAWLLGIPWNESAAVARLLGEKVIMNEFVGYVHLSEIGKTLSDRTVLIAAYSLCGFANLSSIGIQIGGIGAMAPSQRPNLAKLGLLAVLGGNLACFMSACIAGLLF
jgi:CNT family concentrative nucleoside transporter